jgi:hypothetical protein
MAFLGLYEPQTNIPKCEVVYGQFTVTAAGPGTTAAVSGWDKGWTVARSAAGIYRVTLANSQRYPANPLVYAFVKPAAALDSDTYAMDWTAVGAPTAGTAFDIALVAPGTPNTAVDPPSGTVTVSFMAVFKNTNT